MRVAFKIQHGVDHVLKHARTSQRSFLGNVTHQHDADAAGFGGTRQVRRTFAHLGHRPRCRRQLI